MYTLQDENYNIHGIMLSVAELYISEFWFVNINFMSYYFRDFNKFDEKQNLNFKANLPLREMQIPTNISLL